MSPLDHNKTVAVLYSLVGGFFALPILGSPWIIAKTVDSQPSARRDEQALIAVVVFCVVLFLALLFLSVAVGLFRKRSWGRRLALIASVPLLLICWPLATYGWWFMHSEEGKRLYGMNSSSGDEP